MKTTAQLVRGNRFQYLQKLCIAYCFHILQAQIPLSYLQSLHKGFGARLGDGSQVVNQVSFGHANSSVNKGQGIGLLVWDDVNLQILAAVQL